MSTCRSVGGGNPFILRVASRLLKQNHSLRSLTVTLGLCLYLCFMICLCVGFLGKRKTNFLSICSDVGNQRVAGNAGWTGDANLMHKLQQLRRSWVPLAGNWSIPLSHEIGGKTTRCSRSQFELFFLCWWKKHGRPRTCGFLSFCLWLASNDLLMPTGICDPFRTAPWAPMLLKIAELDRTVNRRHKLFRVARRKAWELAVSAASVLYGPVSKLRDRQQLTQIHRNRSGFSRKRIIGFSWAQKFVT